MKKWVRKMFKTMKCPKGHKLEWIDFADYKEKDGKIIQIRYYYNLLPPHALLCCSKCGRSYAQRPIYLDNEGNIRIQLDNKPTSKLKVLKVN